MSAFIFILIFFVLFIFLFCVLMLAGLHKLKNQIHQLQEILLSNASEENLSFSPAQTHLQQEVKKTKRLESQNEEQSVKYSTIPCPNCEYIHIINLSESSDRLVCPECKQPIEFEK